MTAGGDDGEASVKRWSRRQFLTAVPAAALAGMVAHSRGEAASAEDSEGNGLMLLYDALDEINPFGGSPEIAKKEGGYTKEQLAALEPPGSKKAYFALGCYWGAEANFRTVPGVASTRVGFMGGKMKDPYYENLGDHLEVVEVTYTGGDETYRRLLEQVVSTTFDFVDLGHRYARGIFAQDDQQYTLAAERGQGWSTTPVIRGGGPFYPAKMSHQGWSLPRGRDPAPNAALVTAGLVRTKQHRHYAQDCPSCAVKAKQATGSAGGSA